MCSPAKQALLATASDDDDDGDDDPAGCRWCGAGTRGNADCDYRMQIGLGLPPQWRDQNTVDASATGRIACLSAVLREFHSITANP